MDYEESNCERQHFSLKKKKKFTGISKQEGLELQKFKFQIIQITI